MTKIFQTIAAERKGIWHVLESEDKQVVTPLCRVSGFWFGGYHGDKPELTKERCKRAVYDGTQELCVACVEQAYKAGMLTIKFK